MKKIIFAFLLFTLPVLSLASIDYNLKYGAKGQEVIELQEFLIDKGFLQSQATGNFYSLTQKAVIAYQSSVQLPATGYVGVLTRGKINDELLASQTVSDQAETQETGTTSTPINTSPSAMTQAKIDQLVQQVKDLLAQTQAQTAQIQAQTTQTQQQTQILGQIQQNTIPTTTPVVTPPVQNAIIPVMDKSDFIVTHTETPKSAMNTAITENFNFDVKDSTGKSQNWSDPKFNDTIPNIHIVVTKDGEPFKEYHTYDANYPWGRYNNQFNPDLPVSGTYVFTFTANGITKSVTVEVQ